MSGEIRVVPAIEGAGPGGPVGARVRLRLLLKAALRRFDLRCPGATYAAEGQAAAGRFVRRRPAAGHLQGVPAGASPRRSSAPKAHWRPGAAGRRSCRGRLLRAPARRDVERVVLPEGRHPDHGRGPQ